MRLTRIVKGAGITVYAVGILISLTLEDVLMKGIDVNPVLTSQDCAVRPQPVREHRMRYGWQGRSYTVILGNEWISPYNEDVPNQG